MSTVLGKKLSEDIIRDMDTLLGRGHGIFPFPLSIPEMKEFWHNLFPADIVAAHKILGDYGMSTVSQTEPAANANIQIGGKTYKMRLRSNKDELLVRPRATVFHEDVLQVAWPSRFAPWASFVDWCTNNAAVETEFHDALQCTKDLVEMCNTAGQLIRAVPELKTHLSGRAQAALRYQTGRSPMPFEWSTFDRDRIANLQRAMCKACLVSKSNDSWTGYYGTWVWLAGDGDSP